MLMMMMKVIWRWSREGRVDHSDVEILGIVVLNDERTSTPLPLRIPLFSRILSLSFRLTSSFGSSSRISHELPFQSQRNDFFPPLALCNTFQARRRKSVHESTLAHNDDQTIRSRQRTQFKSLKSSLANPTISSFSLSSLDGG